MGADGWKKHFASRLHQQRAAKLRCIKLVCSLTQNQPLNQPPKGKMKTKKEQMALWKRVFTARWAELFDALDSIEKKEVMHDPSGRLAQSLNQKAGEHASVIFNLNP